MKLLKIVVIVLALTGEMLTSTPTFPGNPFKTENAEALSYVNGYRRSNGTYVSGHYKDTSADGNPYNNASYLY